jgi:triosephosphate isomerase (TIM)
MICAGNWKMNKTPAQAAAFVKQLRAEGGDSSDFVIFPPALLASTVAEGLKGSHIGWGGQNCYFEAKGAFTGETSPMVLKEMGAGFCLVVHSERRALFGETDELLAKKFHAVQSVGLTPILCVGETLSERDGGRTEEVILGQLKAGLSLGAPVKPFWIAYEPVWAIGTGKVATPEQVGQAHTLLREALPEAGKQAPILYGGSAKPDNVGALSALKNVDGFLIGGASLEVADFVKIHSLSKR